MKPFGHFSEAKLFPKPDYADSSAWAALPWMKDMADLLPRDSMLDVQADSKVDVFFIHPTIYTHGRYSRFRWNADYRRKSLNKRVDKTTIKYQASLFNGVGRVYAPRYRQAHIAAFYTKRRKKDGDKALDFAYQDVKEAFDYYMKHFNQGRPFIIAGHSQGAYHGRKLLKDEVEGTQLQDQLVVGYLAGYRVDKDYFKSLKPCETPEQTSCFCSWRTYERRFTYRKADQPEVVCTNPISWRLDGKYVPKTEHKGAILKNFRLPLPQVCDAEVYQGYLAVRKPKFPGSVFMIIKNYHPGDFNLFYFDVRENARLRSAWFFAKPK